MIQKTKLRTYEFFKDIFVTYEEISSEIEKSQLTTSMVPLTLISPTIMQITSPYY